METFIISLIVIIPMLLPLLLVFLAPYIRKKLEGDDKKSEN